MEGSLSSCLKQCLLNIYIMKKYETMLDAKHRETPNFPIRPPPTIPSTDTPRGYPPMICTSRHLCIQRQIDQNKNYSQRIVLRTCLNLIISFVFFAIFPIFLQHIHHLKRGLFANFRTDNLIISILEIIKMIFQDFFLDACA